MVTEIIKDEFYRRLIEEGLTRIEKCLSLLCAEEIWHQENENSNAVGNIILHLCGNVRQYIQTGVYGQEDVRKRDNEFKTESRIETKDLLSKITTVVTEANAIVSALNPETFKSNRKVQGFEENVTSIIIHVIEHFSYHVGQITFYTKLKKNVDTAYYAGLDLNASS